MGMTGGYLTGSGGVQTNVSDYLRGPDKLKIGNNINMVKRGILTNKYAGWTRQRATAFNGGTAFLEFAVFSDASGGRTLCFQVGDKLYSYDGAVETSMDGTALGTTNPPCIRMFAPYSSGAPLMIYCNGSNEPRKYANTGAGVGAALQLDNGTGAANYPVTLQSPLPARSYSKPKFCEPFRDRLILAGFDGSTTAYDVLFTNSGFAEKCNQAGATPVATDGGVFQVNPALGPITALKAFKLSNESNDQVLLVGQAQGVSIIIGRDGTDFKLFTLTTEYGIPSNRCLVQMQNDLWFLATDGLRRFTSLASNANLVNATMTFDIQDLMNRILSTSAQWAHMSHMRKYQELVLWIPIDANTQNENAIVINYNNDAPPEQINPIYFTKSGTEVAASIVFKDVFYGGGYTGLLQTHYSGNLYDTAPVEWEILMSIIKPENPEHKLDLQRVIHITDGDEQKFLCNVYGYEWLGNTLRRIQCLPYDHLINEPAPSGTVLGSWVLGSGALPASGVTYHAYEPQAGGLALAELQLKGNDASHVIEWVGSSYRIKSGGFNA
jgi:hypothetical protein